jgi:Protein of unknown function (DUF2877)
MASPSWPTASPPVGARRREPSRGTRPRHPPGTRSRAGPLGPGGGRRAGRLARGAGARRGGRPGRRAGRLLGRGPGLTPEGDDVLAGAAAGLRALGPAAGADRARLDAAVAALAPRDAPARTGALSATLLALAAAGGAPEPAHRLLADGSAEERERALADLARLGASSGRAIAAGIALAARSLAEGALGA